ncbi:CBS domain-containing protein [Salinisphaera sp. USBA-960]|uniref:HlyC/CorC family transporter n=1 Tax=Salinisphaera orenii TaxID=856731 RepID=UPI000DBE09E3|nr:CBS domain-containing protein [Salifodinibacter halophilus]NNC27176.1 CBS domain-containing protein [Salifodinibacter halophilus]
MNDDETEQSRSNSWLRQIGHSLVGPPRDREEFLDVLTEARENELFDADALWMMRGVLNVSELRVRDIMVARSQMTVIGVDDNVDDILSTALESGHSRFPVVGDSRDEVVGVLLAKDLLTLAVSGAERGGFDIDRVLRSAVYVPEAKRVDVLLKELRASRNHMAVVVDEYGGVAGLITIEDALEEIVGEIDDEFDRSEGAQILKLDDNRFQIRSLTPVEAFNRYFETEFADDEFDTIGGLVVHEFGHVPGRGETTSIGRFSFTVVRADSRRMHLLEMTILPGDAE